MLEELAVRAKEKAIKTIKTSDVKLRWKSCKKKEKLDLKTV